MLNDVIFLGPLIIPVRLLLLAAAGIAGYLALLYRLRAGGAGEEANPVRDHIFNTLLVGILIWKFSPLILDFRMVLDHPMSLLYFTGGREGVAFGLLYVIAAFAYRTWKAGQPALLYPDALLTMLLAGSGVYAVLLLVFREGGLAAALTAILALGLSLYQLMDRTPLGGRKSGNLLTVVIVLGLAGWGMHENLAKEAGLLSGPSAADFELASADGRTIKLSDYRGKRVLLNFWATWCPPCKAEMPHLEKFYKTHADEGVVVLAVNLTHTEKSTDSVVAFAREYDLTFPVALDAKGQASDLYGVRAYPTSIIIDSNGIIQDKYQGAISYDIMAKAISKVRSGGERDE